MWKGHCARHDLCVMVQEIKIQCSGRIRRGTHSAELSFHPMQKIQQFNGLEGRLYGGDRVDEGWGDGIRPSRGFIERRNGQDFHTQLFQPAQRAFERLCRRTGMGRKIAA